MCVAFTSWMTSWATTVTHLPFAVLVIVVANLYVRCWTNIDSSSPVSTRKWTVKVMLADDRLTRLSVAVERRWQSR